MKFLPERFLGEDKDLAWLELKLVIIRVMQRGITLEDTPENIGGYEDGLACFPKKMAVQVRIEHQ